MACPSSPSPYLLSFFLCFLSSFLSPSLTPVRPFFPFSWHAGKCMISVWSFCGSPVSIQLSKDFSVTTSPALYRLVYLPQQSNWTERLFRFMFCSVLQNFKRMWSVGLWNTGFPVMSRNQLLSKSPTYQVWRHWPGLVVLQAQYFHWFSDEIWVSHLLKMSYRCEL